MERYGRASDDFFKRDPWSFVATYIRGQGICDPIGDQNVFARPAICVSIRAPRQKAGSGLVPLICQQLSIINSFGGTSAEVEEAVGVSIGVAENFKPGSFCGRKWLCMMLISRLSAVCASLTRRFYSTLR